MKPTIVLLLACGLTACSSTPVEDRYYSLTVGTGSTGNAPSVLAPVIVGPIELADFLDQSGLVMQIGANEIRTANHHFWAEPLDNGIGKVLSRDLSARDRSRRFERDRGRQTDGAKCRVEIDVDRFHATSSSQAVVSGEYRLIDGEITNVHLFEFERRLTADGYSHAVGMLRALLELVGADIHTSMMSARFCTDEELSE